MKWMIRNLRGYGYLLRSEAGPATAGGLATTPPAAAAWTSQAQASTWGTKEAAETYANAVGARPYVAEVVQGSGSAPAGEQP